MKVEFEKDIPSELELTCALRNGEGGLTVGSGLSADRQCTITDEIGPGPFTFVLLLGTDEIAYKEN